MTAPTTDEPRTRRPSGIALIVYTAAAIIVGVGTAMVHGAQERPRPSSAVRLGAVHSIDRIVTGSINASPSKLKKLRRTGNNPEAPNP